MGMGLNDFPDGSLTTTTGGVEIAAMWANMLFWAFLLTTAVYVTVGVACAVSMRLMKKGVSVCIPLFFFVYAELRVVFGDAIALRHMIAGHCPLGYVRAFVASIYTTSGWSMSSLAALGWGVGLSALSLTFNTLTSLIPVYAVL